MSVHDSFAGRRDLDDTSSERSTVQIESSQGIDMRLKHDESASSGLVGRSGLNDDLLGRQLVGGKESFHLRLGDIEGHGRDTNNLGSAVLEHLEDLSGIGRLGKDIRVSKGNEVHHDTDDGLDIIKARVELSDLGNGKGLAHLFQGERLEDDLGVVGNPLGGLLLEVKYNRLLEVEGESDALLFCLSGQLDAEVPSAVGDKAEGLALVQNL